MQAEPRIVERPEQPYAAVRGSITMQTFAAIADRFPEVFGWLAGQGMQPAGAPFFRYTSIDMEGQLEVAAGVPIVGVVPGEGDVFVDVLPAGRFVTLTHLGHPDELVDITGQVLTWAADRGLEWDMTPAATGEKWGCRLEVLLTNPQTEPDMSKWETELVFRLA